MVSKTVVVLIFVSIFFAACVVFGVTIPGSATITVDINGGGDYTTIQAAINAAEDGDEIFVSPGVYYENIVITKDLTLIGQNKDTTIIDGGLNGHVIRVHDPTENEHSVSITGFTIRRAGKTGNDCIAFSYVNTGNIENNNILNSGQSSGIQLDNCQNVIIRNNLISNHYEHGIHLILSTQIQIHNNRIQDNQRGIFIDFLSTENTIYDNEITGNRYGVTILATSSNNVLYRNDFTNNGIQNAEDAGTNTWSHNSQGNYWSDYDGVDSSPQDGIGDTAYNKNGVYDAYPLGYFQTENQKPTATITAPVSGTTVSYHTNIVFNGHGVDSDGSIAGYQWTSSINGQISTSQSFTTSSLSAGTHTISFRVVDNQGLWSDADSITLTVTTPVNQKPTARILSLNPSQTTYGTMVYFSGEGSDTDGTVVAYQWSSDIEGILSTQTSFAAANLSVGNHTISLRAQDNSGEWSNPDSRSLFITPSSPTNTPPVAQATGPATGSIDISITFDASSSYDTDGAITLYRWNFGDGTTQDGITVQHTYTTPGEYHVTLSVTDNNGAKTTDTITVTITTDPQAAPGNNTNQNSKNDSEFGFDFEIPPIIIAPIILLIFITVIAIFYYWIKRT